MEENKTITPSQYFDYLKDAKKNITTNSLKESYEVFLKLGEKYSKLGQTESLKRLLFLANTLMKEEKLIEMGVSTYIYKSTIEDYIENVADKTVKIVELSRYMREIPDELVETIEKTREYFDEFYVVFTDYTGTEERKVEKERRDKDPILFGCFKNGNNVADRFYFLGDWVDEFCDLTLDKMVEEYKSQKGVSPTITEKIPTTSEELIETLNTYKESFGYTELSESISVPHYEQDSSEPKKEKSFFSRVRSIFKKY